MTKLTVTLGFLLGAALVTARANGQTGPAPAASDAAPTPTGTPEEKEEAVDFSELKATPSRHGKTTGLEVGVRTGYGIPIGNADGATPLHDVISGMVPIWVDLGYRATPSTYWGAYVQYGFGSMDTDPGKPEGPCASSIISCSTTDWRVGFSFHLHLAPTESFDPWIGTGVGIEVETFSVSGSGASNSVTSVGLEFANLELGGDWNVTPDFAVGPFVSFSLGQYQSIVSSIDGQSQGGDVADKAPHEWLVLGLRTTFDLALHPIQSSEHGHPSRRAREVRLTEAPL
jgi:hypothetical protein